MAAAAVLKLNSFSLQKTQTRHMKLCMLYVKLG
jgi:hypothetical protein